MTCSETACGTGIGNTTLPGDPDNNSILTATPTFGGIEVSWTLPATNAHGVAYVRIYRGLTNDVSSAIIIANASGDRYFDRFDWSIGTPTTQYYWIQFVSVNGTLGELIGPAAAVPQQTIDQIIEQLTAKIDYGMLSVALKGTVDKADLYKIAQESVNSAITGEQVSIRDALALVQEDIDGAFVLISNEVQARQSAGTAFASSLNTLAVSTGNNLVSAQTELQTFIDDLDEKVGALYTAKVTVNGLVGGFGIYNDGTEVEAGFDVDKFWIGRTAENKRKPFIVSDGIVYIDNAAIADASISLAKIDKATIQSLSAVNADMGSITAGNIRFNKPGDPTSYIKLDSATQTLEVWNEGVRRVRLGNLG